jgi:hypothetical protein
MEENDLEKESVTDVSFLRRKKTPYAGSWLRLLLRETVR